MQSRREREEYLAGRLLEALRGGNEIAVHLTVEACRKVRGERTLGPLIWTIQPSEAKRLITAGGMHRISVLSEHPNGHIREEAVRWLAAFDGPVLPPLLRRANDWVRSIAGMATSAVIRKLPRATDQDLRAITSQVFALTRVRRNDCAHAASAFIAEAASRPNIARRLRHHATGAAARWLFQTLRGKDESEEDVLRQALSHGDPGVRGWAAPRAAKHPVLWELFYSSRSAQLRRLALEFGTPEVREAGLIDLHPGVRNDARYLVGKRDFAGYYRDRLPMPGAVSGLGEVGARGDKDLLVPLLEHKDAQVRVRAVESLYRLIENDAAEHLLRALYDPSGKVRRAAATALAHSSIAIDPSLVISLPLSPYSTMILLERSAPWSALIAVLSAPDQLPRTAGWLDRLALRISRRAVFPSAEEAVDATVLLRATQHLLPPHVVDAIQVSLRTWARL